MKKYLLILILLFGSFSIVIAQNNQSGDENNKQDRIKALYVAYVTEQLRLTPDESQKFWSVHTQFEVDMKTIKSQLSELDKQQAILDIKKRYQEPFTKIIGSERCESFFRMREGFTRKLLENRNRRIEQQRQTVRPKLRRGQ